MIKSILIINQAWSNHGDEAAHKALVRMLTRQYPRSDISVLVHVGPGSMPTDYELFRPAEAPQVKYLWLPGNVWSFRMIRRMLWLPLCMINLFIPLKSDFRRIRSIIQSADMVVSAPGGVDLGPYQNWGYVFRLILSLRANKPTAVYSISFGPLPYKGWQERRFSRLAKYILRQIQFLSLRDIKSQEYAQKISVNYIPSCDTAFLDDTPCSIPSELVRNLANQYAVFIPNAVFRWHPEFRYYDPKLFENLYRKIIQTLLDSGLQVVMLPQLFGTQDDEGFFRDICQEFRGQALIIISDHYSCEVQQAIISNAEILVGARYHSIVFSIKSCIPFLALSYEHKISSLLVTTGLEDLMYDLRDIQRLNPQEVCNKIGFILQNRDPIKARVSNGYATALNLARTTRDQFCTCFP